MLNKDQIAWKNRCNALAWCSLKGYRFLSTGAFNVYYVTPEQEGKAMQGLAGEMQAYSSINWLKVFSDLDNANIPKIKATLG